jgi:hypothetical protein
MYTAKTEAVLQGGRIRRLQMAPAVLMCLREAAVYGVEVDYADGAAAPGDLVNRALYELDWSDSEASRMIQPTSTDKCSGSARCIPNEGARLDAGFVVWQVGASVPDHSENRLTGRMAGLRHSFDAAAIITSDSGRHCERRSDGPRNCSKNTVERRIVFNVAHMMATGQTRSRLICRRRQSPATGAGA